MKECVVMTALATAAPRAAAGLCLVAATTLLAGCGGTTATGPDSVVTVTVTPTVTAGAAPPTVSATGPTRVKSDVVGRRFDLGTIVGVQNEGGRPVIIFDRWTAQGVPDSTLATNGVPIHVHSDAPYRNQNTTTYRVPVATGAVFTYRHCVAVDQPPVLKSSNLDEFTRLPAPEKVVLLTIDPRGQAVKAENDPAC